MTVPFLDAEQLEWIRWGLLIACGTLALLLIFVLLKLRKLLTRIVVAAVVLGSVGVLWNERAELNNCVATCSCSLLGQEIKIPVEANPNCS